MTDSPRSGKGQAGAREFAFTTVDGILIRTILAICIPITRPPLGDAVAVLTLEVGGLTGVIDGCQQKRGTRSFFLSRLPHQVPEERSTPDLKVGTLGAAEFRLGGELDT